MAKSKGIAEQKPLSEFFEFASDFKSVTAWIGKAAVVAPFGDLVLNIGPPWPTRTGICLILAFIDVAALMWSFEFWRSAKPKTAAVRRNMKLSAGSLGLLFFVYIVLFGTFVFELPDAWHRDVGGFSYLPSIKEMKDSDPTKYTDAELLELFSRSPERIWTRSSIVTAKVMLCITWLLLWIFLAAFLSAFIALRWRSKDAAKKCAKAQASSNMKEL